MRIHASGVILRLALVLMTGIAGSPMAAQDAPAPGYLRDRGRGVPASLFGTYIERGQLLLFPFYAYSRDHNREYQPAKLGFGLNADFRGKFRSTEGLLWIGYGVTDRLALEVEGAYVSASLRRSPLDTSGIPARIEESGIADLEAQLRWRGLTETGRRPEISGFVELTSRIQPHKKLISERYWDLKPGVVVLKGFSWGTLTLKVTAEWTRESHSPDLGEVGVEYLRRLSPSLRGFLAVEGGEGGAPDEFEFIAGVRWRIRDGVFFKFDNSLGISSKATDWAPQVGIMVALPR